MAKTHDHGPTTYARIKCIAMLFDDPFLVDPFHPQSDKYPFSVLL